MNPLTSVRLDEDEKYALLAQGVNTEKLQEIEFDRMPMWLSDICNHLRTPKYCHKNARDVASFIVNNAGKSFDKNELKICLGYLLGVGQPMEHCYLRLGQSYFDPTLDWTKTDGLRVLNLVEIDYYDAMSLIDLNCTQDHGLMLMCLHDDVLYQEYFKDTSIETLSDELQSQIQTLTATNSR